MRGQVVLVIAVIVDVMVPNMGGDRGRMWVVLLVLKLLFH